MVVQIICKQIYGSAAAVLSVEAASGRTIAAAVVATQERGARF